MLKPGGIVAISDDDLNTITVSPDHPFVSTLTNLMTQIVLFNGGNPFYSRHLRSLVLEAGFVRTEGFAVAADHYGRLDETQRMATIIHRLLNDPALRGIVLTQGWATQAELDEMCSWILEWGNRPDAFLAIMYCAALGWKE